MTNIEITQAWERAERMAETIYTAYALGIGTEQAKKDQKSLAILVNMAKENGFVYNGCYDEILNLKL